MRRDRDEGGIIGAAPARSQTAGLGLFDQALEPTPAPRAKQETAAFDAPEVISEREFLDRVARIQRELAPLLVERAKQRVDRSEEPGITAVDVHELAAERHLAHLLGPKQRAWSWIAGWFAQLARDGALVKFRLNGMTVKRMGGSGNEHAVYLHPYDSRAKAAA